MSPSATALRPPRDALGAGGDAAVARSHALARLAGEDLTPPPAAAPHPPKFDSFATLLAPRSLAGAGTPEAVWQAWLPLSRTHELALDAWLPRGRRVVVVAPHPDGEVLACGGLLAMLAARSHGGAGLSTVPHVSPVVVGVTDGEASHPGSRRWTPDRLAATRRVERAEGLKRLGLDVPVTVLGLPDGQVAAHEDALVWRLLGGLRPDDLLLTTWRHDGHPDHEATGRACARASELVGCALLELPVWAWHWATPGDARVPWHRLRRVALTDDALQRKRAAIAAHHSQQSPDGDRPAALPEGAVARLMRSFEAVFVPDAMA